MGSRPSSFKDSRPSSFEGDRPSPFDSGKRASSRHDIRRAVNLWLGEGKAQGHSAKTHLDRETTMTRFCWWIENELGEPPTLDRLEPITIREFLTYLREPRPEGRWGTDHPNAKRTARPSTVDTYYRILRAFVNFCVEEGLLSGTPMKNVKAPRVPKDQIQPFTIDQVDALISAARGLCAPERDVAVIALLIDTGMRVSELCALNVGDWEHDAAKLVVTGKGNKRRAVCMATNARRALWRYIERRTVDGHHTTGLPADTPLFVAGKGRYYDGRLTAYGVYNIVARAGKAAGIEGVRCSPHTCRHFFAINFLRNGGNLFELQQLMGHEDLTILKRYVALAETDVETAHRKASPGDRLKMR